MKRTRRDRELLRLRDECGDDFRMRVTETHRRVGAHEVQKALAVDVGQPRTGALPQHDGQWIVVARAERVFALDVLRGRLGRGARRLLDMNR